MTTGTTVTRILSIPHVRAALLAAGQKDIRYYLNGVRIEETASGTLYIGLDGYRTHIVRDASVSESVIGRAYTLSRTALEAIIKAAGRGALTFRVTLKENETGDLIPVEYGEGASVYCPGAADTEIANARYPDWRRVLPRAPSPETPCQIQPQYLLDVQSAAVWLGMKKAEVGARIRTYPHDNGSSVLVGIDSEVLAGALVAGIMGVRDKGNSPTTTPDWARGV